MQNTEKVKAQYIAEASDLLKQVYDDYKDKGMLSIYLWGSVTRNDWDPKVSDIDAIAIVNHGIDLGVRSIINQRLKENFSHDLKLGLQFFGIEELDDGAPYTLLAKYQPAGYLLLRFNDWLYVAGTKHQRSDFTAKDFTPAEARSHQLNQSLRALKIVSGEIPIDDGRHGLQSMVEDAVKGAIGSLYWEAVDAGYSENLDYDNLPSIVSDNRKDLAAKLVSIRKTNTYTPDTILSIRTEIEELRIEK